MDFKDYYDILGVSPDADKKEIQQTFRKLARKYHPDINPGNKEAEDKFKTVNEAYQVLSDVAKRKKFDELRAEFQRWKQSGRPQQDFDWQNWSTPAGNKAQTQYANAEDMEDLFGSDSPYSEFFKNIFNQSRQGGGNRGRVPTPRRGRDVEYDIDITLQEAYHGADRLLEIDHHRIKASIPAGVRTGSRVRLIGQGEPGYNTGPAGDLFLIIKVLANDTFEREGDNLHVEIAVDFFTAILGGETIIPTLDRPLSLKIPPLTNSRQNFRLRGKGMPHLSDQKTHGDLFAKVRLVLPEKLTDGEIESIRELSSSRKSQSEMQKK